ncbi:MAG: hypothetical protein CMM06_03525 [Rhodopirellula sp.]|nr:hypothetical protein [Rhodopirellula sp.]
MQIRMFLHLSLIAFIPSFIGCVSSDKEAAGTANGALIGAAAGAAIGANNDSPLSGALIGATTGAIAGNIIGETAQRRSDAYEAKFQQDQALLRSSASQRVDASVTIEQVERMVQANVSDDVIISQLQGRGAAQNLSTDDIINLTQKGISAEVIKAYQSAGSYAANVTPPSTTTQRSNAGPVVVERHYHHSPRAGTYYQPYAPSRRSGIILGIGN